MTHVADHSVAGPALPLPVRRRVAVPAQRRLRCRDRRWPAVVAALGEIRATKRCSVRIVDADCGAGGLLLCAVRYARALGFTAIEARGIDAAPVLVGRARAAAADLHDPAIGISFETTDLLDALEAESSFPADIVMCHDRRCCSAEAARALMCAGNTLIADPVMPA